MQFRMPLRLMLLGAFSLVFGLMCSGQTKNKIVFSTQSDAAKQHVSEAIRALEFVDNEAFAKHAREALAADSNFAFAQMLVASSTRGAQRKAEVEKMLALAQNASPAEQRYLQGMQLSFDNKPEEAVAVFEKLAKDLPGDRMVKMMAGQLNMQAGNYDQAIDYFNAANQLDAGTPRAWTFLGQCYMLSDRYEQAKTDYQKAVDLFDKDATPFQPFFGLAWTHLYEGDADGALKVVREYLARYERNGAADDFPPVWIWNHMARITLEDGNPEQAYEWYKTGYELVPGSKLDDDQKQLWYGRLLHGEARSLAKMGRYDEAWKIAEGIKKMITDAGDQGKRFWPAYHYLAGYILLEKGDYQGADEHLEQANTKDAFQKLLLARAKLKLGDKDGALELYKEITQTKRNSIERALAYPEAKKMSASMASN